MSITAIKAVLEHSPTTGTTRLVEVVLASHVNEERVKAGYPAEVWPSQRRLAERCNCSRRTIQEKLPELEAMGRIIDTGKRKGRGAVVWELPMPDWTDIPSSQGDQEDDWTDIPSSGEDRGDDWTGGRNDWTGGRGRLDGIARPTGSNDAQSDPEQGNRKKEEQEVVEQGPSPSATDVLPSPSDEDEETSALPAPQATQAQQQRHVEEQVETLAALEAELPKIKISTLRESTERRVAELKAELTADGLSDLEAVAA